MEKRRIDFERFEVANSGAKFYKAIDSEEGYYHVCDSYAPGGSQLLEYMPEIYKHDISICLYVGKSDIPVNFCPCCGKKLN